MRGGAGYEIPSALSLGRGPCEFLFRGRSAPIRHECLRLPNTNPPFPRPDSIIRSADSNWP